MFCFILVPNGLSSATKVWTSGRRQTGQSTNEWTWTNTLETVAYDTFPTSSASYDGQGDCIYIHFHSTFSSEDGNLRFGDIDCSSNDEYVTVCELRL